MVKIKNNKKEIVNKHYQDIIDELSDIFNVPSIPVRIVNNLKDNEAEYGNYEIFIEEGKDAQLLIHEFVHYIFNLSSNISKAEEKICSEMENFNMRYYPRLRRLMKIKAKKNLMRSLHNTKNTFKVVRGYKSYVVNIMMY